MSSSRKLFAVPIILGLLFGLAAVGFVAEARQVAGKKRVEEEDDKPKKKRVEEEDDRASSGVSRLDEDAEKQAPSKGTSPELPPRAAAHPVIKALLARLAIPHDVVSIRGFAGNRGQTVWVEPLAEYIPDLQTHKGSLTLHILDRETGKRERTETYPAGHIDSIRWYEQAADDEVKEFLSHKFTAHAESSPLYLGPYDQLVAAEKALSGVLLHHRSARERGARKGDGWDAVGNELATALLNVQLSRVNFLAGAKSWEQAFALTRKLVDTYTRPEDRKQIAGPLGDLLNKALKDPSYTQSGLKEARVQLRFLEEQFPGSGVGDSARHSLQEEAKSLFNKARELVEAGRKREAVPLLRQAEEVWPQLPGLHAYRMRNDEDYQVLNVGVRELPRWMSPGWACTDAELRAVELMFESLVAPVPRGDWVISYRPELAEGRPKVPDGGGRQFQLPRQARWSDGQELRVDDLRATLRLLQKGDRPAGRSPAWGDLLGKVDNGADPSQVKLRLRQGLLDPLGAMSFKLLPRHKDATSEAFAKAPVGSGPFVLAGLASEDGRAFLRFEPNPHYGVRDGKRGLPRIREVRFYAVADAADELRKGRIHLATDLTGDQAHELGQGGAFEVTLPSPRLPNRRIYFLAVNNRHPALAQADVRVALARAIPRERLLDEHFRGKLGRKAHKALNGPYPAGSWACDKSLVSRNDKTSLDPFDPDLARAKLGRRELSLTLKYPSGDKSLDGAMRALCDEVKKALPTVTLKPEPRPAHQLRDEVETTQNYELAYYHHDFVDETLWLFPLLGPHGRAGAESYLGYTGPLVANVQAAMSRRDFEEVRKFAHAVHGQFLTSDMPLVPLWQLDPLCAYDRRVVDFNEAADPLPWFHETERWRVRPR